MDEKLQRQITFHLTGRRDGTSFETLSAEHRPALLARYHDLTSLRYDLPLVLNTDGSIERCVLSLSGLVDEVVESLADDPSRDRIARHGYQLEKGMRQHLRENGNGDFAEIWNICVARLAVEDETIQVSADRLWAEFFVNGMIVDADEQLPTLVVRHIWTASNKRKARTFRERTERLLFKLHAILDAEFQGSAAGRSPERLKASVGTSFAQSFDFDALSDLINTSKPSVQLSPSRRARIERLIATLENQRFYPIGHAVSTAYEFTFDNCQAALDAFNGRSADAAEVIRALAVADLETSGEYREAVHDAIFESFDRGLDADQLTVLPDHLITINASALDERETALVSAIISSGLPFKVLVQTDDVLEPSPINRRIGLGTASRQLADIALGKIDVFVHQSAASNIVRSSEQILQGLTYNGPALFSIFSGAGPNTADIPAYLVAAAAAESRAFPTFVYDPSAGRSWAERFSIGENPQPESEWPSYELAFEDESLQARLERIEFTTAEFISMDRRYRDRFAVVPEADWSDAMVTVRRSLSSDGGAIPELVPTVTLVDGEFRLCRAVVDGRTLVDVSRCLKTWLSMQELGGFNKSFAERTLADADRPDTDLRETEPATPETAVALAEAEPADTSDAPPVAATNEPYIETARCTSCNECTQINNKLFAYNADKQAFIADPDAGTYRQLVEAAEGCQVSIIHPGLPRNPKEPGLEDLIKRAETFN